MFKLNPLHRSMKRFISICTIIHGTQQYYILVHIVNVASYISYRPLLEAADTGRCFCYQCCNVVIGKLGKLVHKIKTCFLMTLKKRYITSLLYKLDVLRFKQKKLSILFCFNSTISYI